MKVTVRIHNGRSLELKTKTIESDGRVTLIKDSRKKAQWRPKIEKVEPKIGWFGRSKFFTEVLPYAEKTFVIESGIELDKLPKWDKDTSKAYIGKKILDKAGESEKEKGSGAVLWVIAILVVVNIVLSFLLQSGRLRI